MHWFCHDFQDHVWIIIKHKKSNKNKFQNILEGDPKYKYKHYNQNKRISAKNNKKNDTNNMFEFLVSYNIYPQ